MIVSLQSNKARALHIKRNRFWKPVSFDQKFGRRPHQTTRRKPAEVSLLSFHFASSWETSASRELSIVQYHIINFGLSRPDNLAVVCLKEEKQHHLFKKPNHSPPAQTNYQSTVWLNMATGASKQMHAHPLHIFRDGSVILHIKIFLLQNAFHFHC